MFWMDNFIVPVHTAIFQAHLVYFRVSLTVIQHGCLLISLVLPVRHRQKLLRVAKNLSVTIISEESVSVLANGYTVPTTFD